MMRAGFLLLFAFLMNLAMAHDLDLTLIKVDREPHGTTIRVTTALSQFIKTAGLGDQVSGPVLDAVIRERLHMGERVPAHLNLNSQDDTLTWSADLKGQQEFKPSRFDECTPSAQTIVADYENGVLRSESVLSAAKTEPSAEGMLGSGIRHILSGLDHILFVVGLALLGGGWKAILKVLTAFTLAHSLTLLTTAMGVIHGNPRIVEPLIALSIVALAIEGLRIAKEPNRKNIRLRVGLAFGFGLIHGFGFAGGLVDLGLQGSQLVRNLTSFSLGIEFGQMLILAPTLALLALSAKAGKVRAHQFSLAATTCLGMIGSFWFVERVL